MGNGEKRKRFVIVKNLNTAGHDKKTREHLIETVQERINQLNARQSKQHSKQVCALKAHRTYGKYVKELKNGTLKLNKMKLREAGRYDGKYIVETSDDTLSVRDVVIYFCASWPWFWFGSSRTKVTAAGLKSGSW